MSCEIVDFNGASVKDVSGETLVRFVSEAYQLMAIDSEAIAKETEGKANRIAREAAEQAFRVIGAGAETNFELFIAMAETALSMMGTLVHALDCEKLLSDIESLENGDED